MQSVEYETFATLRAANHYCLNFQLSIKSCRTIIYYFKGNRL